MPFSVIGISSTFLGVVGFYLSAGFYSLALIIDIICASEFGLWKSSNVFLTEVFTYLFSHDFGPSERVWAWFGTHSL